MATNLVIARYLHLVPPNNKGYPFIWFTICTQIQNGNYFPESSSEACDGCLIIMHKVDHICI